MIDFCKLNIPDLPQEPKNPEPPISPDRGLDPGVDDTWQDNPPVEVPVVVDPWVENVPV